MRQTTVRSSIGIMLFIIVCGSATNGAPVVVRDWTKNPSVVQLDTPEDVFAISDPHGDPERLAGALAAAKLIDGATTPADRVKWTGGRSVLVVTGDLIDKWAKSLEVIALLRGLQSDAATQGGRVIITMGNHEAEFLADPLGKKTKEFSSELRAAGMDPVEVANCVGDIGQFFCGLPISARVNDWFFSHGGNTNNRTIAELAADIEAGIRTEGFATEELVGDESILEARLNDDGPAGLPWFRAGKSGTDPQKLLAEYARKLGVRHLVQGHQPEKVKFPDGNNRDKDTFFQRYGLLFLIDSGMSHGIEGSDSTGGTLRIRNGNEAVVICANGTQKVLWDKETNSDLEAKHCKKEP
jgi:Calcineurin-like phosphoesterase